MQVKNTKFYGLVDTGASHGFVNRMTVNKLGLRILDWSGPPIKLGNNMIVSPDKYTHAEFDIEGQKFSGIFYYI